MSRFSVLGVLGYFCFLNIFIEIDAKVYAFCWHLIWICTACVCHEMLGISGLIKFELSISAIDSREIDL